VARLSNILKVVKVVRQMERKGIGLSVPFFNEFKKD
jgi:hypothetical protein